MEENKKTPTSQASSEAPAQTQGVNPKDFILPSKEVHSPFYAQRTGADVLLRQEQEATLPEVKAAPIPEAPQAPLGTSEFVRPLETYQGDIDKYMQQKNVTNVTIVAAEQRRVVAAENIVAKKQNEKGKSVTSQVVVSAVAALMIVVAIGILSTVYLRTQPLQKVPTPSAPFIAIDETVSIPLPSATTQDVMNSLVAAKDKTILSPGLIAGFLPLTTTAAGTQVVAAQNFLTTLAPNIPNQLLRTVQPAYIVGVYADKANVPFIIFSVDSFQAGYAGMLAWEQTMPQSLAPLFAYSPQSTAVTATTTTTKAAAEVLASPFTDSILENHDARVLLDEHGNTTLLWTFIDRTTILIATNKNTLHEMLSRLTTSPRLKQIGQ